MNVIVIGGGISGLLTARALREIARAEQRPAPRVFLLEASSVPGGKVQSVRDSGFLCEWGPAGFLDSVPQTLELSRELGLTPTPANDAAEKRFLARGASGRRPARLHELSPSPPSLVATPLLSARAKLRLLCEPLVPPRTDELADESIASFAKRRIGHEAFATLIDAMQSGIFAGDPERLSVQSCFPKVVAVEREHGSLIRGMIKLQIERKRRGQAAGTPGAGPSGRLTSFAGGMQELIDALASDVGRTLELERPVNGLSRAESAGSPFVVHAGEQIAADAVVLACPAPQAAALLEGVDPALATLVREIEYAPIAVACLGFKRDDVGHPLDGFGFLSPRHAGLRLLGSLFSSTIFNGRAPAGHALLRVMYGGARDRGVLELSDEEIVGIARAELTPLLGLRDAPCFVRVFRHRRAIPQYNVGHGDRLARIDARLAALPGLYLSGNAYRGVGINDCVKASEPIARAALDHLDRVRARAAA
ncbi:MAG: protoporphyrinogen oxidase [Myxococcales bacterium]|nr:protoporphyrinogen oxidase [Myxococcales bacterium]